MREDDVLLLLSMRHSGDFDSMMSELKVIDKIDYDELDSYYKKLDCSFITLMDRNKYPDSLRRCFCPPLLLYYYGNIELLKEFEKTYAFVGSREPSTYGIEMAKRLGYDCAKKGLVVVSGLAKGIDAAVMEGALDAGGKVIGVLGTGINVTYPIINKDLYERVKKNGLIISEYPPNANVDRTSFPKRNRIIAGLGRAVIVGESKMRSGTMTTVRHALDLGREIGAVPHPISSDNGCNALIKEGAALVETAEDIEDVLKSSVLFCD